MPCDSLDEIDKYVISCSIFRKLFHWIKFIHIFDVSKSAKKLLNSYCGDNFSFFGVVAQICDVRNSPSPKTGPEEILEIIPQEIARAGHRSRSYEMPNQQAGLVVGSIFYL